MTDSCLICGTSVAVGIHFSINACRNCQTFFRRSMAANREYTCRRNTKQCPIVYTEKNLCRYCRIAKCHAMGMQWKMKTESSAINPPNLIQNNIGFKESPYSSVISNNNVIQHYSYDQPSNHTYYTQQKTNNSCPIEIETQELCDENSIYQRSAQDHSDMNRDSKIISAYLNMDPEEAIKRVSLDDNKLGFNTECQFYKLKQILHGPRRVIPKCPGQFYTPLQTISFALNLFFDKMKKPPHHAIVMTNDLNFKKLVIYFEKSCLTVAECLMHCNEFCELSKSDRALLFNHFWPFFLVIERIYFSIATFGAEDPRTLIFYDDYQVCGDQFGKFSNPEMTMEKRNQLFELFNPANKYLLNLIYLPMKELKLTNLTEFSYMVGHYLWSLDDIIGVSNEAKALARSVMLSLNNDIHHYYTFTLKETNYAHRISMLMKLNARTNTYCRQKKEIRITSQFFDIFDGSKLYDEKLCIDNPTLIYLRE